MGLTSMFLRQWMEGRRKARMAEFEQTSSAGVTMSDLPVAGARWRRNPDGTWMRWSYLGETWEPQTAAPALLHASENNPSVDTWIVGPDGVWKPYDPDAKPADPPAKEAEHLPPAAQQSPPAPPPKVNPDFVERPEWTSEWKPGWGQEFKSDS